MRARGGGYQLLEAVVGAAIALIIAGFLLPPLLRLADGPDQVHMMQLGRNLARAHAASD